MRLRLNEQASAALEQEPAKEPLSIVFLGVFYTVLSGILVNQNYEASNESDKLAGFFIYAVCGVVTIGCSLIYHAKYEQWGARELFKNHMGGGRWRHTVSFAFAMAACSLFLGLNKGNLDKAPPSGFWSQVGKRLLNTVLLLTVVDFNSARQLISKSKKKNTIENSDVAESSSNPVNVDSEASRNETRASEPIAQADSATLPPDVTTRRAFSPSIYAAPRIVIDVDNTVEFDDQSSHDSPQLHPPYRSGSSQA